MKSRRNVSSRKSILSWVLGLLGLGALSTAYIDPGSGSFIIQAAVAAILGSVLLIRAFWKQIVAMFSRKPKSPEDETPPATPSG